MSYDQFVHLLKDQVQIAALTFMSLLYILKVWQLMKLKPIVDLAPGRGDHAGAAGGRDGAGGARLEGGGVRGDRGGGRGRPGGARG